MSGEAVSKIGLTKGSLAQLLAKQRDRFATHYIDIPIIRPQSSRVFLKVTCEFMSHNALRTWSALEPAPQRLRVLHQS